MQTVGSHIFRTINKVFWNLKCYFVTPRNYTYIHGELGELILNMKPYFISNMKSF